MFQFTQKQRENTVKVLLSVITVDVASLLAGNLFNPKGSILSFFILGCIILFILYAVVLWIDR